MSSLTHAIAEIRDLAAKAQISTDMFISAVVVLEAREQEINASRRSSADSRKAIDDYLETIDGAINPDLPSSDICTHAGVTINRGNSQYANRAKQRLLADMRRKSKQWGAD